MQTARVELGQRSYSIHIGPSVREMLREGNMGLAAGQVVVIADQTVADLHSERLLAQLPPRTPILTFPAGEASKSLATVERLAGRLAELRLERGGTIVAFGGGVAGDLAGFVAATWLRGVRFIQVPTTTLAAVDAAVGGKTGVNLTAGKNLVGAFHQPAAVLVDTDFIATLSARDFSAGLAESVKHAAIRDADFLDWHEKHADALLERDADVLSQLIARNCAIKADVVARDEREAGLRAILNHGHTIGHAIEHLLDYELRHGECVGLGMIVENELARQRGELDAESAQRIRHLLKRLGLPTALPRPLAPADVWETCQVDKKVQAGAVRFVLLQAIGQPRQVADISPAEVAAAHAESMRISAAT